MPLNEVSTFSEKGKESVLEALWREPGQIVDTAYLRKGELRYTAEGREIVGRNKTCFNNRPLYCERLTEGVILAGDRPFVRLIGEPYVYGCFSAAILRNNAEKWFHEYSEVESRYRCGRMKWYITDSALPELSVVIDVVPLTKKAGFALCINAKGLQVGDKLVWSFGGAISCEENNFHTDVRNLWDPIFRGNPNVCKTGDPKKSELNWGMDPEKCRNNQVRIESQTVRLLANNDAKYAAVVRSDREGKLLTVDGSACASPTKLIETAADKLPMACGIIDLRPGEDKVFWAVEVVPANVATRAMQSVATAKDFHDGVIYLKAVEQVQTDTPEPRLDAAIAAVCHAIDASCDRNPFILRHGAMAYSIHFLGWRVICGSTALGWHERVWGNAAYYIANQVHEDELRTKPEPDIAMSCCHEGQGSRLYGRGRISNSPHMFNTQSQFFDQTIHDWRWTANSELEKILRPALELHLEWAKDCFDPDDDGLYESYINTLPTDSVWYNGGGSVEESAYAYYGHVAAMDMARRAGDNESTKRHQMHAEKIKLALKNILWLKDRGHFGLYVEQGGHRRVHSDAWLYSVFLPVDFGIITQEEALQSLYYTEWGLERIRLPFGGMLCQPSNWVPSKWSVRDMFGGDICHLALAYFKTGLGDEGWELLLGVMLESAYAGAVPGGFSHIGAGTDFADNTSMFARAVVEGLFGYDPDYPNDIVRIHPAFPSSWPKASIRTPDFILQYQQENNIDKYSLTLTQEADVDFRLPVCTEEIRSAKLDGQKVEWRTEAGFGCTLVRFRANKVKAANVAIDISNRLLQNNAIMVEGQIGSRVRLVAPQGKIVHWEDFHCVLENAQVDGSAILGSLASKPGHHLVVAQVKVGEIQQRQIFKLKITDSISKPANLSMAPKKAIWECMDISQQYNGDVRTIFKQQYLSPRPKTCSVRLGVDGYSAWTFPYWGNKPPMIDLANLQKLSNGQERIITPQNVQFTRFTEDRNIVFTSLWDNWPRSVCVPVKKEAEVVWLLVCGSTFPMQTRIANAEVRFRYADGLVEKLELVPPLNFWSLCPWGGSDYNYEVDAFCLPQKPPPTVWLGKNCRAMVLSWKLRPEMKLEEVTLETLSQDVVIGLMGVSLMNSIGR